MIETFRVGFPTNTVSEIRKNISNDYIRGLVDGEGCFTFCITGYSLPKKKIPAFVISMSQRDKNLIYMIKDKLGLRNKIYEFKGRVNGKYTSKPMITLIVRDFGQLKNIIVPFFYKKLAGNKGRQFNDWIEKIGTDPDVPEKYRFINKLCKIGYYDKNEKYPE